MINAGLRPLLLQNLTFPIVNKSLFIAPSADLIGKITLFEGSSIWYQTVLRADLNFISIGADSNVQDGTVIHLANDYPAIVGARVTIGHRAVVHACQIADEVLVGMGAIILDGAEIGGGCIIGAGALIPKNMVVPPNSLVLGLPARVVRPLTAEERASIPALAAKYREVARVYAERRREEAAHLLPS